jgi:hypothetical protein
MPSDLVRLFPGLILAQQHILILGATLFTAMWLVTWVRRVNECGNGKVSFWVLLGALIGAAIAVSEVLLWAGV